MNARRTDIKIAISLFVSSLLCLAVVVLFSDSIYLQPIKQATPQPAEWTLPKEQTMKVSNIRFLKPNQGEITLAIMIEDRENIKIIDDNCYDDCNKKFNIGKLQSSVKNNQLIIDLAQTVIKEWVHKKIMIKLPSKDWQIRCTEEGATIKGRLYCGSTTNNSKPINYKLIADGSSRFTGNFQQLSVWQLSGLPYLSQTIKSGNINTFTVYSKIIDVSFHKADIQHINLHGPVKGKFETDNFALLQRTTWQTLTETEKSQLAELSVRHQSADKKDK